IASLRERREDVPALLQHYLDEYRERHNVGARAFSPSAVSRLTSLAWPGNIRQLKNVVERMVVKSTDATIDVADLPRDLEPPRSNAPAEIAGRLLVDRSVVADMFTRIVEGGESFWTVAYTPFMQRDLTRAQLIELISRGLERTAGNYRSLVGVFNMPP